MIALRSRRNLCKLGLMCVTYLLALGSTRASSALQETPVGGGQCTVPPGGGGGDGGDAGDYGGDAGGGGGGCYYGFLSGGGIC